MWRCHQTCWSHFLLGANEGVDEDGDDWDTATSSSGGGDSLDFYATDDRVQLLPTHSLHNHHLTDSHCTPSPSGRISSPVYLAAEDPSLSRSGNKWPYTLDSPPPALSQNKRPRVTLDSSATDDRMQLPPIHSLQAHYTDSGRASLPTLCSENPARPSEYRSPPIILEDKLRLRVDCSFNPYDSSFPSYFNFTSPSSPPSWPGPQSPNSYLTSTNRWSAPFHDAHPISNPETGCHLASEPGEQLNSWAFPQYSWSNSFTNTFKHPAALSPISSLPAPATPMAEWPKWRRGKLPKLVTDYLKDGLHCHSDHPYPSEDEKKQLCQTTGLSMNQVSDWDD